MAYAAPARFGVRQGSWPRRVGGGVSTGVVLAAIALAWWHVGWMPIGESPTSSEPLRLSLLPLPRPAATQTPVPPPRSSVRRPHPASTGKAGGGHQAGRPAPEPIRPVPRRLAGGDPIVVVPRVDAPPLVSSAVEAPALAAATPSGASGTARTGSGPDAGAGTGSGSGTGRGSGTGPGDGSGEIVYTKPDWVVIPSNAAIRPYWPARKGGAYTSGVSALACRVRLSTHVHDCFVVAESPAKSGFGRASVDASRIFRIRPPRRDGKPVDDAWVLLSIKWNALSLPAEKAGTPAAGAATPATLDQSVVGVVR